MMSVISGSGLRKEELTVDDSEFTFDTSTMKCQ